MHLPDLLLLGLVGFFGFGCQWLAWRTRLPAILFLLLTGILLGPSFGILDPDKLFGELLFPLISLAVSIILFEGSLTLKRTELAEIGSTVRNMVTHGALVNMLVTTLATHYLTDLSWSLSALFGAIMVVTGPTVIMPMLRSVRPNAKIARTLRWEGIIIDPLGALFAVFVFEWIIAQQSSSNWLDVAWVFSETVVAGIALGVSAGYSFGLLLRHYWVPEHLQNYATIAMVVLTFAISNTTMHESGLLAVTIMGIWLANMPGVHIRHILHFKESLTLILVSVLFILLSARINFDALLQLGWGAVAVLLAIQFIGRPLKVFLSTLGSSFTLNERILLSWVGPRGIVAAAVSVAFALKMEALNIPNAELLVPLAFSVIIGTVVIQSATSRLLAVHLKVNQTDTQGYLVIGANPVAIAIAEALKGLKIDTILCDTEWEYISQARMKGLKTYYGNPISDHAETHIDLSTMGGMLGLAHFYSYNTAAALRFREDFGARKIFSLVTGTSKKSHNKHNISEFYKGRVLFDRDVTYSELLHRLKQGAQIKKTRLTDTYSFEQWQLDNPSSIPLFAVDEKNHLYWFTDETKLHLGDDWRLFALGEGG